jgi:hypothetical protein
MIGLFEHKFKPADIYAYSALFLVLGAVRIGLGLYYCNKNAID